MSQKGYPPWRPCPSGSGKTLILVHHAAFLRRHAGVKRILLVCYNITLVNYLRRLLSNKGIPLGVEGVTVHHFFDLCSEILGEPINHAGEDSDADGKRNLQW